MLPAHRSVRLGNAVCSVALVLFLFALGGQALCILKASWFKSGSKKAQLMKFDPGSQA
jgi:hypothetical protein